MLPHANERELGLEDQLLRSSEDRVCVDFVLKWVDVVAGPLSLHHLAPQVIWGKVRVPQGHL